ncbi:hypothetical protein ACMATS_05825 [Streptoverticillium reticulum]|uniref:hypothetical protein n=1 Tax=Streptoverticillium reticulum TaxID=1433415 RepID=UPI0039BF5474
MARCGCSGGTEIVFDCRPPIQCTGAGTFTRPKKIELTAGGNLCQLVADCVCNSLGNGMQCTAGKLALKLDPASGGRASVGANGLLINDQVTKTTAFCGVVTSCMTDALGPSLQVTGGKFGIKLDPATTNRATLTNNGLLVDERPHAVAAQSTTQLLTNPPAADDGTKAPALPLTSTMLTKGWTLTNNVLTCQVEGTYEVTAEFRWRTPGGADAAAGTVTSLVACGLRVGVGGKNPPGIAYGNSYTAISGDPAKEKVPFRTSIMRAHLCEAGDKVEPFVYEQLLTGATHCTLDYAQVTVRAVTYKI